MVSPSVVRSAPYVSIVVAAWLGGLGLQRSALGTWIEQRTYDLRFRSRGPLPAAGVPVTIVTLDDESFLRIPEPLLLWSKHFARALGGLTEARAASVGLDLLLGDVEALDAAGQQALFESLLRARSAGVPVTLAYRVRAGKVEEPPAALAMVAGAERFAFANLTTDSDDFVRRQELYSVAGEDAPGFAFSIARELARSRGTRLSPPERTLLINYRGRDVFPRVPFWRLLDAAARNDLEFLRRTFEGRIVLVGILGDEDLHSTPLYYWTGPATTRRTPGVEIHAHTIATLLEGDFIRPLAGGWQSALALLLAVLVAAGCRLRRPTADVALGAGLVALFLWAAFVPAFARGRWVWVVAPTAAALLTLGGTEAAHFGLEGREKRRMRRLFERYVEPAVLDRILAAPETVPLGGERREMAVLFCDIRDFTTRAESLEPEVLVGQLNRYLGVMVQAIQEHRGTVDKFIGDGIMALFGAPLQDPAPARSAVEAARAMLRALEALNVELAADRIEPIRIGIGIHAGPAVVGSIGSPRRMEYTAVGDVVNTASRIEGLTRQHSCALLVSAEVRAALGADGDFELVGEAHVKGKQRPVTLYRIADAGRRIVREA